MAMSVKRFDFGGLQDFREPYKPLEIVTANPEPEVVQEQAPPPPPTFTEAQLEAVRQQAYAEGRIAGLREGEEKANTEAVQREQAIRTALNKIAGQIGMVGTRHHEWMRLQNVELSQLVLVIAQQVAGQAIQLIPQAGVEAMIQDCLNVLLHQPRVMLTVHPAIEQQASMYLHEIIARRGGECAIQVMADDSLDIGDARLEWKDGEAERSSHAIWQQIEQMLQSVDFTTLADKAASVDTHPSDNE